MIRVLQVLGGLNLGGAETMVMNLYRRIDKSKIQFDFIIHLQDKQAYEDEVLSMGGKVYRFPAFNGRNLIIQRNLWEKFFIEHKEYKILHSHVRSYASVYIPIANKYGLKTIIHSHSTSNGNGLSAIIKNIMQYPLRFQADYLFACSEEAGQWLFGKKACKKNNYKVIHNAIDSKKFSFCSIKRKEIREKLGINDKFVIGHVGRMTKPKNHTFLLRIFLEVRKIRKDAVLLLIGDGELRSSMEKEIRNLGIMDKVLALGSKNNIQDYYQAMDVFVFPSLWEGLGIVCIEAQASGLPCVVSENVPKEIDLGENLIHVMNLSDGEKKWADVISSVSTNFRYGRQEAVCRAGYDIEENAMLLEDFYSMIAGRN